MTNNFGKSVTGLNSKGGLIGNFNNNNTPGAGFEAPDGVAIDVVGNVWVTNSAGAHQPASVTELSSKGSLI